MIQALGPMLGPVLRLSLRVLRIPFLLPIITLLILFRAGNKIWCEVYDCNGFWEPAFPYSWRAWFMFLVVAPINAVFWLCWLLGWEAVAWCFRRRLRGRCRRHDSRSRTSGSPADSDDDEDKYLLVPNGESEQRNSSPSTATRRPRLRRLPSLRDVLWWVQVVLYASIALVGAWEAKHYEHSNDVRFRPALQRALKDTLTDPIGYGKGEKIFIAAAFYNNQDVIPYWAQSMLSVISYLGSQNIFVSIVESHSGDDTPNLLRELEATLKKRRIPHRILIHDDDAIEKPSDLSFNNRINFLAAVRNRALEPLVQRGGYDRVLFSNDVFIEPESIIELIETRNGDYDMACAMDFGHFGAYDAWVLRDRLGHLTSGIWPYFIDKPSIELMRKDEPIPAFACWNGMVIFDAEPMLPIHLRRNRTLSADPLPTPLPRTHPATRNPAMQGPSPALTPPLRFRSADREAGECFSSESFLIPYDFRRQFNLQRIYVNPRVVTSYGWKWYVWFKWALGHRFMRWWVREVYDGHGMERKKTIVGAEDQVWVWDGGDCHPWW